MQLMLWTKERFAKMGNKVVEILANLSGILIPISLASITLVGAGKLQGAAKNLLMFTIPTQIILLIVSLCICINILEKENKNAQTHFKYCKYAFIVGLIVILISHLIVFFSP